MPAIEEMIYEGLNINVTLLFGVEEYAKVAEAYIRGLERRLEEGKSVDINSVASFFVSRVDTEVDKRLEGTGHDELWARPGSPTRAPPTSASRRSSSASASPPLRDAGARRAAPAVGLDRRQEPGLPATRCTSRGWSRPTPSTRCRWPRCWRPATTREVSGPTADERPDARPAGAGRRRHRHGRRHRPAAARRRRQVRRRRWRSCWRASTSSARRSSPSARRRSTPRCPTRSSRASPSASSRPRRRTSPGASGTRTTRCGAPAGQPEVANRLGWLTVDRARCARSCRTSRPSPQAVRDEGITDVVLLGMGGSSLAPEVIRRSFGDQAGWPTPARAGLHRRRRRRRVEDAIDLDARAVPGVDEVRRHDRDALAVQALLVAALRRLAFVAITDPGSGLADLAEEHGFRRTFLNDPDIGGRYSALSYFGLVPAALMGADVAGLLRPRRHGRAHAGLRHTSRPGSGWGSRWGELAAAGPRQAHLRHRRAAAVLRPLGRAAHRGVDRQGGQGHPAGGRRAARGARRSTATTASSCTCATPSARRGRRRGVEALKRPATP